MTLYQYLGDIVSVSWAQEHVSIPRQEICKKLFTRRLQHRFIVIKEYARIEGDGTGSLIYGNLEVGVAELPAQCFHQLCPDTDDIVKLLLLLTHQRLQLI